MDYGILKVMGDPIILLDGEKYTWQKYMLDDASKSCCESVEVTPNEICITKAGKTLRLIGIKNVC